MNHIVGSLPGANPRARAKHEAALKKDASTLSVALTGDVSGTICGLSHSYFPDASAKPGSVAFPSAFINVFSRAFSRRQLEKSPQPFAQGYACNGGL